VTRQCSRRPARSAGPPPRPSWRASAGQPCGSQGQREIESRLSPTYRSSARPLSRCRSAVTAASQRRSRGPTRSRRHHTNPPGDSPRRPPTTGGSYGQDSSRTTPRRRTPLALPASPSAAGDRDDRGRWPDHHGRNPRHRRPGRRRPIHSACERPGRGGRRSPLHPLPGPGSTTAAARSAPGSSASSPVTRRVGMQKRPSTWRAVSS
jgi:hypothetical protein